MMTNLAALKLAKTAFSSLTTLAHHVKTRYLSALIAPIARSAPHVTLTIKFLTMDAAQAKLINLYARSAAQQETNASLAIVTCSSSTKRNVIPVKTSFLIAKTAPR